MAIALLQAAYDSPPRIAAASAAAPNRPRFEGLQRRGLQWWGLYLKLLARQHPFRNRDQQLPPVRYVDLRTALVLNARCGSRLSQRSAPWGWDDDPCAQATMARRTHLQLLASRHARRYGHVERDRRICGCRRWLSGRRPTSRSWCDRSRRGRCAGGQWVLHNPLRCHGRAVAEHVDGVWGPWIAMTH